jgi:hypothetical protein
MALTRKEPTQIRGRNGAGPIPLSNVRAGEQVFGALNLVIGTNDLSSFESVISVNGQIQQVSVSDLRGSEYLIYTFGS